MGEYDDMPYIVIERRSAGATPFLWGLLLGAGVALLLAPRSGAETQEEIRERARRVREAAEGRVNEARDTVTGAYARTRDRIQDRMDNVRSTFEERSQQAREAIDAGRRAARDARAELERRVAQAKGTFQGAVVAPGEVIEVIEVVPPTGPAPVADVVITDVVVEEAEGRPDLG